MRRRCSRRGWRWACASACCAAGVEVYERSPVRRLIGVCRHSPHWAGVEVGYAQRGGVAAHTDGGVVAPAPPSSRSAARRKASAAPLRNALTVTSSHIVLTEPVPELLEEIGWTGGECITDCRAMIDYFRTTPDGRIAFGWGGGRIAMGARLRGRAELDPEVVAAGRSPPARLLPRPRRHAASPTPGAARSTSRQPTCRSSCPCSGGRTFAAAGYTGNGVGPSYMVGRTLASLALDRRDEYSRLPFVDPSPQRVPPEPFHWLGGSMIRRAHHAQGERRVRRPHPAPSQLGARPHP